MNNFSRPAPKLISDDTPDEYEVVLKGHFGSKGALFALINHLREIGAVSQGSYDGRRDGTVKQTITLNLYKLAKSYATPPEKPIQDKSGRVYLFRSRKTIGRYKIGVGVDVQRRLGQVNRAWDEDFERIHSIYSDDAYALENALHKQYVAVKEEGEKEIFWLTDEMVDEIRAK